MEPSRQNLVRGSLALMALILWIVLGMWPEPPSPPASMPPTPTLAVTVDDLPFNPRFTPIEDQRRWTAKLLWVFRMHQVPAIGFVNEIGVMDERRILRPERDAGVPGDAQPVPERVAVLKSWLDARMDLGNHTYSHPDLHHVPLDDYLAEIETGDEVTAKLLAERGQVPRFFRHPFLHTGRDLETKRAVENFLEIQGYRVAPVTHDNSEWIFALAYRRALEAGNDELAERIGAAYGPYMIDKLEFFERNSRDLFDREIPQVLLIHMNRLNADHFGALAQAIRERGYRFVSLETALEDPAYASKDTYTGPAGITWLHRWALTRGVPKSFFQGEPEAPAFVLEAAGMDSE